MHNTPKPFVLMILDGWGYSQSKQYNPTQTASTPTLNRLFQNYPYTLLAASGTAVGLPDDQIGNSEVGHLHIGAGRKVPQDYTRIQNDILTGDFYRNPVFLQAIEATKKHHKAVHILGLLSPGGVHSHESQIMAIIDLIAEHEINQIYLHAILDGRDVPPRSALPTLEKFTRHFQSLPGGKIASIIGRYYAMDRDNRWQRTAAAYDLLTQGTGYQAKNAIEALELAYTRGENDEFVKATSIFDPTKETSTTLQEGDTVIFMNFRADRARQLSHALTAKNFTAFTRQRIVPIDHFVTLTEYTANLTTEIAYPPITLTNTLGEYLAKNHKCQLRLAETEKYAHVTYFLNGGIETPFPLEDRQLIPSPNVATYDLKPEMSALEVTQALIEAIHGQHYDVIVCNYANPDMVGHTGILSAACDALITIDRCIEKVIASLQAVGGEILITADHGNIEMMFDETTEQPHTAHTTNKVPLIYVGRPARFIREGALDDIAPTLLYLMDLQPPEEMTGHNLLRISK